MSEREILFRGKRVDNEHEWVYGNYNNHSSEKSISFYKVFVGTPMTMYAVIPETVGQYTGLTDKNGTRIFEGDIISPGGETRLLVCWYDYGWHAKTEYGYESLERDWVNKHFKVIGNIHDKND